MYLIKTIFVFVRNYRLYFFKWKTNFKDCFYLWLLIYMLTSKFAQKKRRKVRAFSVFCADFWVVMFLFRNLDHYKVYYSAESIDSWITLILCITHLILSQDNKGKTWNSSLSLSDHTLQVLLHIDGTIPTCTPCPLIGCSRPLPSGGVWHWQRTNTRLDPAVSHCCTATYMEKKWRTPTEPTLQ